MPSPGNPQSLNRYAYVLGNPLKYVDPTGHGEGCGPTGMDLCPDQIEGTVEWYNATRQLPPDTYIETKLGGFIDRTHIRRDWPRDLLTQLRARVGNAGDVEVRDGLSLGPVKYHLDAKYYVNPGLTEGKVESTALGMFMDYITRWEGDLQGLGGCVQRSCFAMEDMPTFYLGFVMESRNMSLEEIVFEHLGGIVSIGQTPPHTSVVDIGSNRHIQNRTINPMVRAGTDSNGRPQWVNVPWPDTLTITPIGAQSGAWQLRSAEIYFGLK